MAYDEALAGRVREIVKDISGYKAKEMFGGICVLIRGNMACGILNNDLIVRVGPDNYRPCLEAAHTRVFDITGRVMKGWVMVDENGCREAEALKRWVDIGVGFAMTLPEK